MMHSRSTLQPPQQRLRQQRGQVMPYVAFLIFILAGAAFVVFDIGFMINARIQSQNAADAAALAAVSVKINKHHMDSLLRTAMTQEALMAQSELRAAQAIALQAVLKTEGYTPPVVTEPPPGGTPITPVDPIKDDLLGLGEQYKVRMNRAYKHSVKLHRETMALKAWYAWLEKSAPTVVREAARVGYAINMQGYDDLGNSTQAQNIQDVLASNNDLLESQSGVNSNVGGFIYAGEGANLKGMFGKTFVEHTTRTGASAAGVALLDYLKTFEINSNAAATLKRQSQITPLGPSLAMHWYSPYLMAIEGDSPGEVAH